MGPPVPQYPFYYMILFLFFGGPIYRGRFGGARDALCCSPSWLLANLGNEMINCEVGFGRLS